MRNTRGFTLIEIMIAVVIMAFISIFTSRMIQQGVQAKTKIQSEIDRTSGLKAGLALITQDLQVSFNYHDVNAELYNAAQTARQAQSATPKTPPPPGTSPPPPPTTTDPDKFKLKIINTFTRFFGEVDKLNFTSLNNFRSVKNLQESDQVEIGYYLDTCTSRLKKSESSKCLWRRVSPYIDDEVKEGGTASPILENVKSLHFRYLGYGHEEEWLDRWVTEQGEEVMKGRFPNAVEITLTIYDKRTEPPKDIAMTVVAAVRFPNNRPTEAASATTPPGR